MISPELATQLKDAGFPKYAGPPDVPELSDLILACGDLFYSLERSNSSAWRAQSYATKQEHHGERARLIGMRVDAASAEEAVARLWLALNSKSV